MRENEETLLYRIEELEAELLTALTRILFLEAEVRDLNVEISKIKRQSVYRSNLDDKNKQEK